MGFLRVDSPLNPLFFLNQKKVMYIDYYFFEATPRHGRALPESRPPPVDALVIFMFNIYIKYFEDIPMDSGTRCTHS